MTTPDLTVRRRPDRGSDDAELVRAILDEALVVHVGTVRDGWPVVLPMAHGIDGDLLYLHGSAAAGLFRDLRRGSGVCVTATLVDGLVCARTPTNHSMNYRSAVVYGTPEPAADVEAAMRAVTDHVLADRYAACRPPTAAEVALTGLWQLDLTRASAKVRTGGPRDEDADLDWPVWAGVIPVRTLIGEPVADGAAEHGRPALRH